MLEIFFVIPLIWGAISYLWQLRERTCNASERLQQKPVKWIDSATFHEEYVTKSMPACFDGFATQFPAFRKWTPQFLCEIGKAIDVKVCFGNEESETSKSFKRDMSLAKFVQSLLDAGGGAKATGYLKQLDIATLPLSLQADLSGSPFSWWKSIFGAHYLWVGRAGAVTGMHNDDEHNVLVQLWGHKTVYLFPPWKRKYLYPNQIYDSGTECCDVDAAKPDYNTHPLFAKAGAPLIFHLRRGDMLHIPKYWYHQVMTTNGHPSRRCESRCDDVSMSLNLFASSPLDVLFGGGLPREWWILMHRWGLYRPKRCVCH